MPARTKLENAAILAALLICAAFAASFILGLRRGPVVTETVGAYAPAPEAPPARAAGRIEVLNASGRSGLARAATDRLRGGGFDVVFFGNASGFSGDSTLILDRTGDDAVARAVARYLGMGVVRTQRDTTLFVDATVVIGRDWR
jgi:polyisoprenyl-teichoic acid--peptidoglycan teichoic acid transferase